MEPRSIGMLLVALGLTIALIGLVTMTGALSWFGRLPGDIRVESGNTRVYFPIVTMLVVSAVLSLVMFLVRRLF